MLASRTSSSLALVLLGTFAGCQTSGYERAHAAAERTDRYGSDLEGLARGVGLALEALAALEQDPGGSPRSNRETFATFVRERANLADAARRARKTYGTLELRAAEFFGQWNAESARIANADLRQSAGERRTALQAHFERLGEGQQGLDQALARFALDLGDLELYLESDLTAAGIAKARPTIRTLVQQGAALQESLRAQVRLANGVEDSLAPLEDLAPRTTEAAQARVR